MPPRKEKSPSESSRVVIRRVKRKPASTPVVVEKKRAKPPQGKPEPQHEPPRQSASPPVTKPVVQEKRKVSPPEPAVPPQPEQPSKPVASPEAERLATRQRRFKEARVLLQQIMARWPETYPSDGQAMRPLKIGIHYEVYAAMPETPKIRIREALDIWHGRYRVAYLRQLQAGRARYDLAGQVVGEVTAEDEARAQEQLKEVSARKRAKRPAHEEAVNTVGRELFTRWPQVFGGPPASLKPLKHGLEADLAEHLPEVTSAVIKQALSRWEKRRAVAYLRAVAAGGPRYDLVGQPCGEVTPEEAEAARQQLEVLYAEQEAKRQEREQQQPAPPEPEPSEEPEDT